MGNLNNDLNIKDLKELFDLKAIKYLKGNCSITMPTNRKTGKNKSIAFVLSPDRVHNELFKLNGIEFHGESLIPEKAMSPGKRSEQQRQRQYHKLPQVVVNNFPENQDTLIQRAKMRGLTAVKTIIYF